VRRVQHTIRPTTRTGLVSAAECGSPGDGVALLGWRWCTGDGAPGASGTPRGAGPGIDQVNGADASAVGEAFSTATFTYDSLIDTSPADGQRRSADFATPAFATQLRQPLMQGGGALWNEMAAHRGYTTVALVKDHDDGRPPDTATSAVRGWTVTATGHAADGWSAPMNSVVMFVSMTRATPASGWQVSSLRIPAAN